MQGRYPRVGRHGVGAPIARSGTRPPARTGSASGNFVGTGRNNKTAAQKQMNPSRSLSANDYTRQGEQFMRQSPEPFRNPHPAAMPMGVPTHPQYRDGLKLPNGGQVIRNIGRNNRATDDELRSVGSNPRNAGVSNTYSVTSGYPTRNVQRRVGNNRDVPVSRKGWGKSNQDAGSPFNAKSRELFERYGR